jgi:hypothetical protein
MRSRRRIFRRIRVKSRKELLKVGIHHGWQQALGRLKTIGYEAMKQRTPTARQEKMRIGASKKRRRGLVGGEESDGAVNG